MINQPVKRVHVWKDHIKCDIIEVLLLCLRVAGNNRRRETHLLGGKSVDTLSPHDSSSNPLNLPGVYIIVNTVSGGIYIGSSVNVRRRWNEHRSSFRKDSNSCVILQSAWNKYGEESFVFAVLQYVDSKDDLHVEEQRYIDKLKPEYNAQPQVKRPGPRIYSEESKEKIRQSHLGKTLSEEHKQKLREVMTGRQFTPEWIEHLKEAQTRRTITDEQKAEFVARMNTPEIMEKRRMAIAGKKRTTEQREKFSRIQKKKLSDPEKKDAFLAQMNTIEVTEKRRITREKIKAEAEYKRIAVKEEKAQKPKVKRSVSPEGRARMSAARLGKPSGRKGKPPTPKMVASAQRRSGVLRGRVMPRESVERGAAKRRGYKHTPEAIEKMRNARLGKKTSEETKEKLRRANLGKTYSEETKAKVGYASRTRKRSEETGRKISEGLKKRYQHLEEDHGKMECR